MTTTQQTATTTATATGFDGESLGAFTFDIRADWARQSGGLWVYPASYHDLRDCRRRAAHLTETFGVKFFALKIAPDYLAAGASPAINQSGYYAATTAESTPELRRIVQRAYDRARAMTPRSSDTAECEVAQS